MKTKSGTNHFLSRAKAVAYYAPYGYDTKDVDDKIKENEIVIGPPEKGKFVADKEGRYFLI